MFNVIFQNIKINVITVLWRFPLAVTSSLFLTLIALNADALTKTWNVPALILIFMIGIFWFTSVKLLIENHKWNLWTLNGIGLLIFGMIGNYIYNFNFFPAFMTLMGPAFILLPMTVPFLKRTVKREMIWQFHYRLWSQLFFSLLAVLIFIFGILLLLLSLDYLFHIRLPNWLYPKLIIIISCYIFPIIGMNCIPSEFEDPPHHQQGKGIQFLLDYIMTPIWLTFGGIIILYALKTLIFQTLPKGKVSYLVSILGITGLLSYMLGESGKKARSITHQIFRSYFFHLMIIPLILMGIGINVRIQQYGVTTLRYVDALLLFWLAACLLYSFIRPREKFTQFMFISAVSFLLLGSFGPWGIEGVSARSQTARLQNILEKNNILANKVIQKTQSPITPNDQREIISILLFLIEIGQTDILKLWFGSQAEKTFDIRDKTRTSLTDLCNLMGIQENINPSNSSIDYSSLTPWYSIRGYDYFIPRAFNYYAGTYESEEKNKEETFTLPNSKTILLIKFEESTQTLILKRQGATIPLISISMREFMGTLHEKSSHSDLEKKMIFKGSDTSLKVCLIIKNIRNQPLEPKHVQYMDMALLVKFMED
jgi:hypothetical protein